MRGMEKGEEGSEQGGWSKVAISSPVQQAEPPEPSPGGFPILGGRRAGWGCWGAAKAPGPPPLPDIVWQDVERLVGVGVTPMGSGIWELEAPPPNPGHPDPHPAQRPPPQHIPLS